MDRNNIIGLILIFIVTLLYLFIAPRPERKPALNTEQPHEISDSLAAPTLTRDTGTQQVDTLAPKIAETLTGGFPSAADQSGKEFVLENADIRVVFSSKGGRIVRVLLKKYKKLLENAEHKRVEYPLYLLHHPANVWNYHLPYPYAASGYIQTQNVLFEAAVEGRSIRFIAQSPRGEQIEIVYRIDPEGYEIHQHIALLQWPNQPEEVRWQWVDHIVRAEQNTSIEKTYSALYYKLVDESPDYLGRNDEETIADPIEWISSAQQFFNTSIIPSEPFAGGQLQSMTPKSQTDSVLQIHTVLLNLPFSKGQAEFTIYCGPNQFELLRAYNNELEYVIPFGWGIFGTINRWVIRPLFHILASIIGSYGFAIVLLTILVKLALSPLNYKMLYSQMKMAALKPLTEKLREKFKNDPTAMQMEMMKIYREYGVNPYGGCLPMLLQLPIWIALYRFFPAAIEFRQEPFLWAHDLSSYDVLTYLPFDIPFVGHHISLFTLLWVGSTLIYTHYNLKMTDTSMMNPSMKYMQYILPVMFFGFFNSYASGLTAYLFISNVFTIGMTLFIKKVLIDEEKIKEELRKYKAKPKKKIRGFAAILEQAMREQQKRQKGKS